MLYMYHAYYILQNWKHWSTDLLNISILGDKF